ncbi:hypothetical protein BKI52_02355 [marine bacterium AO1-C]|nr:hypothetical protein BKI52_02355 [marine bacterium AO1-C]
MKRIVYLILFCVLAVSPLQAQLGSAISQYNSKKFDKAKQKIDECLDSEKLKAKSKMWYYRGLIYAGVAQNPTTIYGALKEANPDAMYLAYDAFNKAMELEPKKRGYYKDSKKAMETVLYPLAVNEGVSLYQKKQKEGSLKAFELAQKLNPKAIVPFIYGGDVARELKMNDKYEASLQAISNFDASAFGVVVKKADLDKLTDADAKKARLMQEKAKYVAALVFLYRDTKQYEKGVTAVDKALKDFPNDDKLRALQVELYVKTNKLDQAIKNLEGEIQKNPKAAENYVNLGIIYEKSGNAAKAEETYKRCLKVDPENFNANYNLAVLPFNQAANIIKEINKLTLPEYNKRGKKMEAEAVANFKKSLPFFEKLEQKKPSDTNILRPLGQIYNFLSKNAKENKKEYAAKYKEIEKKISGE